MMGFAMLSPSYELDRGEQMPETKQTDQAEAREINVR